MKKVNKFISIFTLLFFVALMSCGDKESSTQLSSAAQLKIDIDKIEAYIVENGIQNVQTTTSGLHYVISTPGSGQNASSGSNISVHYTGKFLSGGVFDSSIGKDPFEFPVGTGRVIFGWDEGLQLFNTGAKGLLLIPSILAYGPSGRGSIGPNTVLIFEVEMVSIN
jgi:FKBP-type peptidyl-prolyl cis-trans isomerase